MITYLFNYNKRTLKAYKQLISSTPPRVTVESNLDKRDTSLQIGIMDPTIGTANQGDFIIKDAISKQLLSILPNSFITNYPSQLHRGIDTVLQQRKSEDLMFVAGTNLLSSNMNQYYQWKVGPLDAAFLKNRYILFGVGWWQYQDTPNSYTRWLYQNVLSTKYSHAVRDSYAKNKLEEAGIKNVINTSCPTLWDLTKERCMAIPTKKATDVVTTLTFYHKDPQKDKFLLDELLKSYQTVYLWIQGFNDLGYLHELGYKDENRIQLIEPTLQAFDEALKENDIDYVGTRLHAGVRALQHGRRTMIVAVDNRALEISRDTNLNVVPRTEVERIQNFTASDYKTQINLPQANIDLWKSQFLN
ncbi:polysaccharide pyruvyl transferase family protein [Spirosoma utsteinense]|uniref:Polysaccharide pyruvyl transferase WcaK-like protein n=1 Tax=Spirosoma utsteinense TaxID=2585773 RepID=A0ABR6W8Z1_9BACT|nr:polysaccharide pyruvyl transferase family protein [Spirosoma utsteinense]MBC3787407.1 polysaccharide pyruvyl transferase WcaK-like protein [Spirosoma utsteinense]MBC3793038.1 polysaccharide pyruvyl transferase WcaK-like protein [Spirosoma utsteinense]